MEKERAIGKVGRYVFALPWVVICFQHFMYADFLSNLVPSYMPARIFWVYFTGIGMMAAGISLIINVKTELAAACLGLMLVLFILQLHIPIVSADISNSQKWARALQDISIAAIAFILTGNKKIIRVGRYVYAFPLLVFGVQHFLNLKFVTTKVPEFMPLPMLWDYLLGIIFLLAGVSIIINKKMEPMLTLLGLAMMIFIVLQLPALFADFKNPIKWVVMMLELCIASGAFILIGNEKEKVWH